MASTNVRHRPKQASAVFSATAGKSSTRPPNRMAMAKRGLRSLAVATLLPLSLTTAAGFLSTPAAPRGAAAPWHPPEWAFHLASACTAALAGFAAWLVWAVGGFRREPAALPLYLWQLASGAAWAPLVLGAGAAKAGLAACAGAVVALAGCSEVFARVNPIAGSLVRPCAAWVLFLAFFTFRLL